MNDRVKNKDMAGLLATIKGNDPRNFTKRHEEQFVLVRVISWIVVSVCRCSRNMTYRNVAH